LRLKERRKDVGFHDDKCRCKEEAVPVISVLLSTNTDTTAHMRSKRFKAAQISELGFEAVTYSPKVNLANCCLRPEEVGRIFRRPSWRLQMQLDLQTLVTVPTLRIL
jgi:hypothetical protein